MKDKFKPILMKQDQYTGDYYSYCPWCKKPFYSIVKDIKHIQKCGNCGKKFKYSNLNFF